MAESTPPKESTAGVYLDGRNVFPHGDAHRKWDPDDPGYDAAARDAEEKRDLDELAAKSELPSPFRRHAPLIARAAVNDFFADAGTSETDDAIREYLRECERGGVPGSVNAEAIPIAWREGYAAAVKRFDEAVEGLGVVVATDDVSPVFEALATVRAQAFDTEEAGK